MNHYHQARFARLLLYLASLAGTPAAAASFDGLWTVNITTQRGSCESGSSLPIQVSDGRVASSTSAVTVSGQVATSGGITVVVVNGLKRASGSGRLSETSGAGTWHGGLCSGTWVAQKS